MGNVHLTKMWCIPTTCQVMFSVWECNSKQGPLLCGRTGEADRGRARSMQESVGTYWRKKKKTGQMSEYMGFGGRAALSMAVGKAFSDVAVLAQRLTHGYVEEEGSRQRNQNHHSGDRRSKLGVRRVRKEASVEQEARGKGSRGGLGGSECQIT